MSSPVVTRARSLALALGALVLAALVVYLLLGWARRSDPTTAPAVDPAVVLVCLLVAAVLVAWALGGRARDAVNAQVRARHPERRAVLATAELAPGPWSTHDDHRSPSRRALRAWWRPVLVSASVALAAVVLLGLTSWVTSSAADDLGEHGVQTPAQVTATGWSFTGLGYTSWARVTHAEEGRTVSSTIHGVDPVALPVGTQVTLLVDPEDREAVRAVDRPELSAATLWWRSLLQVAAVVALLATALAALRRVLWRRRVAASGWVPCTLATAPAGRGAVVLLEGPQTLLLTARGRGPGEGPARAVAGEPGSLLRRRSVLVDDGHRLVELRLPATMAEHARALRTLRTGAPV